VPAIRLHLVSVDLNGAARLKLQLGSAPRWPGGRSP
jgi:hypothetical protein